MQENKKNFVLQSVQNQKVVHMDIFIKTITNKIQLHAKNIKLKNICFLFSFFCILLITFGFIQKYPKQNYSGHLTSGNNQLFPLKNENAKKDSFPSSGIINLNNTINRIYKNTPPLKQSQILNRQVQNAGQKTTKTYKNSSDSQKQNAAYRNNLLHTVTANLAPYFTQDKYNSNTYNSYEKRKKNITPYVNRYADKFKLDRDLVMSIIQVESNFMPHALSKQNAHGLMQIVPEMAAAEVNRFFKHSKNISSIDLMHPESNIYYGTAYLHLLKRYHLNGVKNNDSMNHLVIASYNAGSTAVLRHFGATKEEAINKINSMTADEIYTTLTQSYRSAETREYLKRVTENLK